MFAIATLRTIRVESLVVTDSCPVSSRFAHNSVKAIREEASQITELPSSTPTESEEPQGVNSRTQGVTSQAGPSKAVNREADLSALCEEVTHEPCAILLTPLNVS